jgi:tRNA pseudouridine32 synthase/23S rRNA pseudouridine746 synthase
MTRGRAEGPRQPGGWGGDVPQARLPLAWSGIDSAVVIKPAGVSSEGAPDAALEIARAQLAWPDARLPHRLDRLTSGFLLVARDGESAAFHSESVRERRWVKVYLARLEATGHSPAVDLSTLIGSHKAYLKRDGERSRVVRAGGDPSFLEILAIARVPAGASGGHDAQEGEWHAAIRLLTGRFHQIRVMCAHLGAPLAGDPLYGGREGRRRAPTLEHAVFSFPMRAAQSAPSTMRVTLWDPRSPTREPIAQSVLEALELSAGRARAMT